MGFKEDILALVAQINTRKQFITNEETTKHSLIVPFIQVLGYDVFDPLEVRPEYSADFGKKKGEKVDYAIIKNDKPIIFIEAKNINENLQNHDAQLSRYFNSTPEVKLAILTNGIKFKFFTDLKTNNIMDSSPFYEVDISNLTNYSIEIMQYFSKEVFDVGKIVLMAEELMYVSNINTTLLNLFENPSDEFIKLLIKEFNIRSTSATIEKFRPIVKKSIKDALIEIVSKGIYSKELETKGKVIKEEPDNKLRSKQGSIKKSKVTLDEKQLSETPEELEVFEIIKKVLIAYGKSTENLTYKKTSSYFSVNYINSTKWFMRLNLDSSSKSIITRLPLSNAMTMCSGHLVDLAPKGNGESRIIINNHTDIKGLKSLIVTCFEQVEE